MLLGTGSLVIALAEPQQSGVQTGFVASTIGITAIVIGVRTVKANRWTSATARAFGRGGAILGIVGTALMLHAVLATGLTSTGVYLPALSLPSHTTTVSPLPMRDVTRAEDRVVDDVPADDAPAAEAPAADTSGADPGSAVADPAPTTADRSGAIVPTTRLAEQAALTQAAGTLAFTMRQSFGPGTFPADLAVGMAGPERIMLTDGTGLAPVPDGARVLYSVSPDGSAWSVTIIGATFGTVATYSSAVGTVQVG